ncbi:MAG: selenocysteine-specific translation elongation factor [Gemmatimonadota bacterium]
MIIGTAGHVDHGKSALVEALTGHRMDRLAEERRRGITIELNFAPLALPDGRQAGIVDVPGHEDFVQTMVAGASGLDLVLLIVAADEGLMPQTREHRAIIQQLRVPLVLPVVTKRDLVDPDWLELVLTEVAEWSGTEATSFLTPLAVSARTGEGIEDLRQAIFSALGRARVRDDSDAFRMPVDRVFSVAGTGTVITGTTWSGQVEVGQTLRLMPGGVEGRIRSIESFGQSSQTSRCGARTAIGLAGIDREQVRRGDLAVAADNPWQSSLALDVELELLPEVKSRLSERTRVRVHLGTAEVMARIYPRGKSGGTMARLVLETPLTARGGDRLVLRSFSPVTTIGGGRVLDPVPPRRGASWPIHLMDEDPSKRLEALIARRRWGAPVSEIPVLLGVPEPEAVSLVLKAHQAVHQLADRVVSQDLMSGLKSEVLAAIQSWHQANPFAPGMPLSTLRQEIAGPIAAPLVVSLVASGAIQQLESVVRLPGFRPRPRASAAELDELVTRIEAAGVTAPSVGELERELGRRDLHPLFKLAAAAGRLVAVASDRYVAPAALDGFVALLRDLSSSGTITPAALRDRTGLSRKFLIPLLEWSDQAGITRREGDGRTLVRRP